LPEIAIIIVNWNTKDLLRACLESIYKYPPHVDFEVIVVDNASTDGSPEMVKAEFPQVVLIQNEENVGFAKANNQAIRQSESNFVLLLNSDTEVLKGSIDELYGLMQETPKIGIAGPLIRNSGNQIEESCGNIQTPIAILATKLSRISPALASFTRRLASHRTPKGLECVGWVTGACMLIRRTMLNDIGLFDESFFMYFEDSDLCYRASRAGWHVMVDESIEIFHHRGASKAIKSQPNKFYRKSMRRFYGKHFICFKSKPQNSKATLDRSSGIGL